MSSYKNGGKEGRGQAGAGEGGGGGRVEWRGLGNFAAKKKSLDSHETVSCTCSCPFVVTAGLQKSSKQRQNLNSGYFVSLQKWEAIVSQLQN